MIIDCDDWRRCERVPRSSAVCSARHHTHAHKLCLEANLINIKWTRRGRHIQNYYHYWLTQSRLLIDVNVCNRVPN